MSDKDEGLGEKAERGSVSRPGAHWFRRLVGRCGLLHPIWHYPLKDILRCVQQDWDAHGTTAELEDLIKHADIHSNYPMCGYDQMTSREKFIFRATIRKPFSWESSQNSVTRKAGNSTDAVESVPAKGLRLTEPRSGEGGA